jgi:integrase
MPRPAKGARLYLRERKGREPQWVIRDREREFGTGCGKGDLRRAEEALARHLTERFKADTGKRDLDRITVAEVLALYGAEVAPHRASAELIGYHMDALLSFWAGKSLAQVKGSTCRAYVEHRENGRKPVKAATAKRELKTLGAAINHWHRESALPAVPRVTLPVVVSRRERVLERDEVAALLRAARKLGAKHVARFILIGLYTGTRHNAILGLRWQSAFTGGHIDIERGIIYRRGVGERETSKRRPPAAIPRRLMAHLRRWLSMDQIERGGSGHSVSRPAHPQNETRLGLSREGGRARQGRHPACSEAHLRELGALGRADDLGCGRDHRRRRVDRRAGLRPSSASFWGVSGAGVSGKPGKLVGAAGFEPATPTPPEKSPMPKSLNYKRG